MSNKTKAAKELTQIDRRAYLYIFDNFATDAKCLAEDIFGGGATAIKWAHASYERLVYAGLCCPLYNVNGEAEHRDEYAMQAGETHDEISRAQAEQRFDKLAPGVVAPLLTPDDVLGKQMEVKGTEQTVYGTVTGYDGEGDQAIITIYRGEGGGVGIEARGLSEEVAAGTATFVEQPEPAPDFDRAAIAEALATINKAVEVITEAAEAAHVLMDAGTAHRIDPLVQIYECYRDATAGSDAFGGLAQMALRAANYYPTAN